MIDTEALCKKVVDLAIQGKLTQQLPEDGKAEDLFAQIQDETANLIKEGKIKKEKALPEIAEEEIPFSLPNSWMWVRLGDVARIYGGKRIPAGRSLTSEDTGHKYIRVSDMKNRTVVMENLLFVPKDIYPSISRYIINKEDIYITVAGTIGKVGKIPHEIDGANLTENADRLVFSRLNQDWLIWCLSATFIQKQIDQLTTQVAQPKLAITRIQNFIIPLPPYEEQKRIANIIDTAFVQIDVIDALQQQYESDREILKVKIIDAGIRGKLTEQLQEDGSGESLYAKIQEEKAKLIKEGKIKKEKPLPKISEDEIPFEIPENWKWVRLASIISLQSGQDLSPSDYNGEAKGIPYITGASNIDGIESLIINRWTEYPKAYAYKGYILLSCKGTVGKLTILKEDVVHIARQIMGIRSFCVDCKYLLYYLESMINEIKEAQKGLIPGIERKDILNLLCPLPPIKEQNRIASKIEAILELVNQV